MDLTRLTVRRSLPRLAVGAVLALAALAALGATAASAQTVADPDYWKQTTERRNIVNRFVYGQSPQTIPAGYDPVREAEQILAQEQRGLPPSNPKARSLWQQIRGVTVKSALSTAPRALGTIALAEGTFWIGWKIGTGINAKFLKLGVPEEIPHTNIDFRGNGWQQTLVWNAAGYDPYFGYIVQPVDGFTWTRYTSSGSYTFWKSGAPEVTCDMNRVAPPAELTIVTSPWPGKHCGSGAERASTDYNLAYLTEEQLGAPGPVEPYTGQPYTKSTAAPTPPPQSTVEQTIDEELGKPENVDLRQWLNYKLGSPGETDPTGIGSRNPILITVPGCEAIAYADCTQALRDAGFQGTITREYASFEDADVTKPAGAVLETQPAGGTEVADDGAVVIRTNPEDVDMPRVVPAPGPHETATSYEARLETLNLVPSREVVTQTPGDSWAGDVLSTVPTAGARARKDTSVQVQAAWRPEALYSQDEQQDTDCEPGIPHYELAGDPFAVGDPPSFFAAEGTVLFWKGGITEGWGERHIAVKHGWDAQDKLDTATTLGTPLFVIRDRPSANALDPWLYAQVMPERNGKPCVRIVRVERGQWPNEPAVRGVITSFGAVRTFSP